MTTDECIEYCHVAALGYGCGLSDPWEFALHVQLHAMNLYEYSELVDRENKACSAVLAFLVMSASCPEEFDTYSAMTLDEFKASSARQINKTLFELNKDKE